MDYKSLKANTIIGKTDIYLVGVYTDKRLSHLGKSIAKLNIELAKKCFNKNDFTGNIGDHRTIDDFKNNVQILFFGLGDKDKYSPLTLNKSIKAIISKIKDIHVTNISINTDNIISKRNNVTLELLVTYLEDSFYKYIYKKEKKKSKIKSCNLISNKIFPRKAFIASVTNGKAISNGIKLAKDLGNTPPNICNPTTVSLNKPAIKTKK